MQIPVRQLYFRRAVPGALRAAFDGKAQVKAKLGTKEPVQAKALFTRENAKFEEKCRSVVAGEIELSGKPMGD